MTTLSALAQLELELINRARMDPLAEAQRAGLTDLNQFVVQSKSGTITSDPKQVLAGNNQLTAAAVGHTGVMMTKGMAHTGIGDGDPASRILAAGYANNTVRRPENIGTASANAFNTNAALLPSELKLKQQLAEQNHLSLFNDDPTKTSGDETGGHRLAMLDPNYKEVGIGATSVTTNPTLNGMPGIDVKFYQTQNFGNNSTQSFLTGAVYNDNVIKDNFYSLGEGVSGVTATVRNSAGTVIGSDTTGDGGGWSVGEPGGTYKVTFSASGRADVAATIEAGTLNAKMDLVNGNEIYANANTTLNEGAVALRLIGIQNINGTGNNLANTLTGNSGNNILTGLGGNDVVDGLGGTDTVVFTGKQSDYKIVVNGGTATIEDLRSGSPDGLDTITNVEFVKFTDVTVAYSALKNQIPAAPVAGSVVINDVSIAEGDAGTKVLTFKIVRTDGTAAFDVNYATADGTAKVSDGDYVAASGTVRFAAGETEKFVSVTINGDARFEGDESFSVNLSNATNSAKIVDATGVGTITNDDVNHAPTIAGSNVTLASGGSIAAGSVFTAQDLDGNSTITKYAFWDGGKNGGYFTIDGVVQAPGQWVEVAASDLAKVKYVGGVNGGVESIYAKAFDGSVWSSFATVSATTLRDASEDFNNDGNTDILFHNTNGSVAMWQMDGNKILSNLSIGTQATSWHAHDAFDFNGDGKADILWENDNGQLQLWQMDGAKVSQKLDLGSVGSGWHVAGVDDFTADGKAEILLVNDTTRQVQMWNMNGAAHTTTNVGTIGTGWSVQDTADFNGDGKADILLRNGSNVAMWQMDGGAITKSTTFAAMGDAFHFAGTGDFNGDGREDILWHNDSNGQLALWEMNGTSILSNTTVGFTAKGWDVANVGDLNHDGHADILLRSSTGQVAEWLMDGDHILTNQTIGATSADWHII